MSQVTSPRLTTPTAQVLFAVDAAPDAARYVADLIERIQREAGRGPLMPTGASLNVNLPVRPGPLDPDTGEPESVLPPGVSA